MLNDAQIDQLADALNKRVDIPLAGEASEKTLLVKLLQQLNQRLVGHVGAELQGIIDTIADGKVDADERTRLEARAVAILNQHIDIPIMGEDMEASLLKPIVDVLVDQARKRMG